MYWSCSTAKKGYSGTAVFLKQHDGDENRNYQSVSKGINKDSHDQEGRAITVHYPSFTFTNLYVPNSGQKLVRLAYRTEEWDKDLLNYMQHIEATRKVPIIWLGDLNVAHQSLDVYNDGAKHLLKQAGCTLEEKTSFSQQLSSGYFDALRTLHPEAQGQYTYWSQRTRAREPNRGLRLDYFVCSQSMLDDGNGTNPSVRDSYVLEDRLGSDHCPVVLVLEI